MISEFITLWSLRMFVDFRVCVLDTPVFSRLDWKFLEAKK